MALIASAQALAQRAASSGKRARTLSVADAALLARKLGASYPTWLADLLMTVPLCGLELGWQAPAPEQDDADVRWLGWCDAEGIISESVECYPGLAILPLGYVNVASCSSGSGDPYFISIHEGSDPPLYQIFHDLSDRGELIISEGRELVASSLSEFFERARLD